MFTGVVNHRVYTDLLRLKGTSQDLTEFTLPEVRKRDGGWKTTMGEGYENLD